MDLSSMERFLPMCMTAAQLTLTIAAIDIATSVVVGVVASLVLYYRILRLRQLVAAYVELSRNMPPPVQLSFLYFGLPKIGIHLSPKLCGTMGLSPPGGAYMTETFRVGLETIERVQSELALSLDMSQTATMRYVVLPQATAVSMPSLVANMTFLIKEASVFSGITLVGLMYITRDLIGIYYQTTETLFMLVVAYPALLLPISLSGSWAEGRLRYVDFSS